MTTARTRVASPDPFNGARGHDYIRLRGLSPRVSMNGQPPAGECKCGPCVQVRLLPAVQALCAARDRRNSTPLREVPWNDVGDETAHALLDAAMEP